MKINDLNKIEEGLASTLFGEVPTAAVKGMFTGKGTRATLEQDIFIKDFIGDAIASLDNGIRSGVVASPAKPARPGPEDVAGSRPASAPAGMPGAVATDLKPNANGYSFKTTQQGQAPKAPLKPTTTNVKFNFPGFKKAAPKVAPKEYPQTNNKGAAAANRVPDDIQENTYTKLNAIFESIIEATEPAAGTAQSITQYMTKWFNKYMGGVDWQADKQHLMPLIQNVEATYRKDKGKKAIKQLAQAAYSTAKTAGVAPEGVKNATPSGNDTAGSGNAASGATAPQLNIDQIILATSKLPDNDLADLKKFVDGLTASRANNQYMGKVAPNAGPATPAANPLTAPTINQNKGTVSASGTAPRGDITKGGTITRESKRPRK